MFFHVKIVHVVWVRCLARKENRFMAGSSAPLRRLGAELRRLREAASRTQTDVGTAIGRTHTTLVNWERGKTKISKSDLVCLLAELRAPAEVRKGLEQL